MKSNKNKDKAGIESAGAAEDPAAGSLPPVFPQMMHRVRPNGPTTNLPAKAPKRENTFSKSRDTREDRGERQIKTSTNTQSQPHGR